MSLQALMETEQAKSFITENEGLILEAAEMSLQFPTLLKTFILENQKEFVGESIDETTKNIRVFTEVATAQLFTELTHLAHSETKTPISEATVNDYL